MDFMRLLEHLRSASSWRSDVTLAARSLRRSSGATAACIVTIALGVGANGAMFSMIDRLFLRPPPGVRDPSGLRRLYLRTTFSVGQVAEIHDRFTYPAFAALDTGLITRIRLAAYTPPDTMPLQFGGAIRTVHGSYVTTSYLRTLGVSPALGRSFIPEEGVLGAPAYVAILNYKLWQQTFSGDSSILGRIVYVNRQPTTIIGVAPPDFAGADLSATDIWMPLPSLPAPNSGSWYTGSRAQAALRILGRIAPGTPNDLLANVATTVVRRTTMGRTNVVRDTGAVMLVGPILESLGPSIVPSPDVAITLRLVGVTIIVLLIACANVANLLLARGIGRRREMAVRLALGASPRRLIAQLLTEGMLLALVAGVVALAVSVWAGAALRAIVTPDTYSMEPVLDPRVGAVTVLIALGTGFVAGLIPAVTTSRPALAAALRGGGREGAFGRARSLPGGILLIVQVALCIMLLNGAGLFIRSLWRIRSLDVGFDAEGVVYATAAFLMPDGNYLDYGSEPATQQRLSMGIREVAARLGNLRGVEAIALTTGGPMLSYAMTSAFYENGTPMQRLDQRDPAWIASTPNYLQATGSRLLRGRFFTDADRNGPPVVVVNEIAARAYWPAQDPLGKCLVLFRPSEPCLSVIGVIHSARLSDLVEPPTAQLFTPLGYAAKGARIRDAHYLILRTRHDNVERLKSVISAEIPRVFSERVVPLAFTASDRLAAQVRPWRLGVTLFSAFGGLALIVAAFGTYSVIAYGVNRRAHEMSVRGALGASAGALLTLVLRECIQLAAIAIVAGMLASMLVGGVLQSLLYDTSSRDPLVLVSVALIMLVVALAASSIPAARAARADPMLALRVD